MGAGYVMRVLSKITGSNFIEELAEFIASFGDMWEGFKARAERVKQILTGDDVAFWIITAPDSVSLGEADYLQKRLADEGIDVGGFVVNRVHQPFVPQPVLAADSSELTRRLRARIEEADRDASGDAPADEAAPTASIEIADLDTLSEKMQRTAREFHVLANRDADQIALLQRRLSDDTPTLTIPFFSTDIYSFRGLDRIRRELFGLSEDRSAGERVPGRI